jgi:hypothetical protein
VTGIIHYNLSTNVSVYRDFLPHIEFVFFLFFVTITVIAADSLYKKDLFCMLIPFFTWQSRGLH